MDKGGTKLGYIVLGDAGRVREGPGGCRSALSSCCSSPRFPDPNYPLV